ncbi:homogentisate phytyltransferase [archaeon]|nr:MAG: homogentisate phytyltransferase [archaeon]
MLPYFRVTAIKKETLEMLGVKSIFIGLIALAFVDLAYGYALFRLVSLSRQSTLPNPTNIGDGLYRQSRPLSTSPQPITDITQSYPVEDNSSHKSPLSGLLTPLRTIWDFSRPHTLVGSALSIISLYLFAIPKSLWHTHQFRQSLLLSLVPSLLMNIFITGLNQLTDIEIDRINKPYLPLAAGTLSPKSGASIVAACLALSCVFAYYAKWPLKTTLLGSALLGTVYSLPPLRLKRFPLLAALCILVVRGSLVNMGFFLQAKMDVLQALIPSLPHAYTLFPMSVYVTGFFALFGVVIAVLKDAPDVQGDRQFRIPTFAVRVGADKMFK